MNDYFTYRTLLLLSIDDNIVTKKSLTFRSAPQTKLFHMASEILSHKGHFYDTFMICFCDSDDFPNSIILKSVLWKKVIQVRNNIFIF